MHNVADLPLCSSVVAIDMLTVTTCRPYCTVPSKAPQTTSYLHGSCGCKVALLECLACHSPALTSTVVKRVKMRSSELI